MAVWKLQRVGAVSAATGELLPPDTEIVTALFGQEDDEAEDSVRGAGFLRKDFLVEEASDEALEGAFCTWRTRTPPEKQEKEKRFDLGMAREFLERMLQEGKDDRASVCLTLALLLARKRRLTILEQGTDHLVARWPKSTDTFRVPAPEVSEADAEVLQQDLMRLFDLEIATPAQIAAAEAQAEQAEDGQAEDAPPASAEAPGPGEDAAEDAEEEAPEEAADPEATPSA